MTRPVDDNLLLELIEGELSPEDEVRVRAELAEDPDLLSRVEAMIEQRVLLRSDPEPATPDHLLAGMEARLARPMLMDDVAEPGTSTKERGKRIEKMRQSSKRRTATLAIAAGLMLTLSAGMWVAATLLTGGSFTNQLAIFDRGEPTEISPVEPTVQTDPTVPDETATDDLDRHDLAAPDVPSAESPGELALGAPDDDTRHVTAAPDEATRDPAAAEPTAEDSQMREPVTPGLPALADPATRIREASQPGAISYTTPVSDHSQDSASRRRAADDHPPAHHEPAQHGPVMLEMMLEIHGGDRATIERSLDQLLHALSHDTALVRNFDYHRARQFEQGWLQAQTQSDKPFADEAERLRTNVGSGEPAQDLDLLAYRAFQQIAAEQEKGAFRDVDIPQQHVAGPQDLLPDISQQLNLSRNGATHTVTLPVGATAVLLERLNVDEGYETTLVPMDDVRSRILPEPGNVEPDAHKSPDLSGGAAWAANVPRQRELLIQLETMEPHQLLHLPIRIAE